MADMVQIELDDKKVMRVLSGLVAKGTGLRPLMRTITGIMARAVEDNFAEEGRPAKWKPLARATIRSRERHGHWPGRILQVKGELARSITTDVGEKTAVVGTNKEYAKVHQFGGKIKQGARSQNVHFRKEYFHAKSRKWRKGVRTGTANRTVFSRSGNATHGMKVSIGEHTITIPARPFLVLEGGDVLEILMAAKRYLRETTE